MELAEAAEAAMNKQLLEAFTEILGGLLLSCCMEIAFNSLD